MRNVPSCRPLIRTEIAKEKDRVVLVLFWAKWSGPDRILINSLETALKKDGHRWFLRRVDVDTEGSIAAGCEVLAVPTLIPFVRGRRGAAGWRGAAGQAPAVPRLGPTA